MTTPSDGEPGRPPPTSPVTGAGQWRPSHHDRQQITERLRLAVDEGRLDMIEYSQRLRDTEAATTMAELRSIVADLPGAGGGPPPVMVQIGEITVTRDAAYTPVGPIPLPGSQWHIRDQWLAQQHTPSWAVALAIVGAGLGVVLVLCTFFVSLVLLLCLLFLLAKETRFHGTVDVSIVNGGRQYVARIPVQSQQQVNHLYHQVNYARSLAAH